MIGAQDFRMTLALLLVGGFLLGFIAALPSLYLLRKRVASYMRFRERPSVAATLPVERHDAPPLNLANEAAPDTWKRTFAELLRRADAILVDLSGYGPRHAGVVFELGQLLATRPLDSFVVITDRHTNIDHLGATLERLWRALDPSLPNAQLEHPVLRVLHEPNAHNLVAALCDAAVAA
jgi:hypothetical protein